MESRKMVLMNLFAGQQWQHRHREQTYGHSVGERVGHTTNGAGSNLHIAVDLKHFHFKYCTDVKITRSSHP